MAGVCYPCFVNDHATCGVNPWGVPSACPPIVCACAAAAHELAEPHGSPVEMTEPSAGTAVAEEDVHGGL